MADYTNDCAAVPTSLDPHALAAMVDTAKSGSPRGVTAAMGTSSPCTIPDAIPG